MELSYMQNSKSVLRDLSNSTLFIITLDHLLFSYDHTLEPPVYLLCYSSVVSDHSSLKRDNIAQNDFLFGL